MWDAEIVSRIIDRKQNEAVVFSVALKNSADLTIACDIVDRIVDDIRFCADILANGSSAIRTLPIDAEAYVNRLSDSERKDEDYLDSIRAAPVESSTMEAIIADLEERNNHLQESLDTVMYELKVTKERNSELSLDLDYAKAEAKAEDEDYFDTEEPAAEAPVVEPVAEVPAVEEPVAEVPVAVEAPVEEPAAEVPAVEEPVAEAPAIEEAIDEVVDEAVKELKILEQAEDDPMNFTKVAAKNVMRMKESKIDYFIDLAMSGRNVKACDDIIEFLKVDYKLCKLIIDMDLENEDDIVRTLNSMLDLVNPEYKTPYQKFYIKNLNVQEKVFETVFNGLMEKAQRIMLVKLPIGA